MWMWCDVWCRSSPCLGHILQRGPSRAVPGLSLGPRSGAVHFFTPRGPQVTINSNLKVTWAPAINKPRIKPVNYPVGARRGPCRHPPGTQGQFLTKSTQDNRPAPWYSVGRLWCPDLACRWPGRCSDGAFTMSERAPVGNLVGTLVYSPGGYTATERRIYQCSINQSIYKSIKQCRLLLILQTVFVTSISLHQKIYTNSPVFKLSLYLPTNISLSNRAVE